MAADRQHRRLHLADARIPGDVMTALQQDGRIPDPYVGRNEYSLRWIAERDWAIERTITLDAADLAHRIELYLSELDTVADVFVNDEQVLQADNQFRRYRIDVSEALHVGDNRVRIVFRSSVKAAADAQALQPWPVPWHAGNCPIPNGNMLRKVQCDFGWDWNIALAPCGLYGLCELRSQTSAAIRSVHLEAQVSEDLKQAQITVSLQCTHPEVTVTLDGQSATLETDEHGRAKGTLTLHAPRLWWPIGLGEQYRYALTITAGEDVQTRMLGLRRLELISRNLDDPSDSPFTIRVNHRPVFCRGANWIPADALPGRISSVSTRALLQSAVDANMNMIRVWGGGRYEPDSFYDACDELGLLVWQDFMFSCNLYPSTQSFLDNVALEVADVVERLHHHACIALWCGDNELVGALNWFEESLNNRDRYLVAYDRLNRTIETTLKLACPQANWWPSSPCSGYMNYGDAWHDDSSGDMHFWSVWHEGRDFEHYRDVRPRFCSEFGFQSYPSMATVRSFATERDFNIASPVMECHQKNAGGNARIAETMFRYFRFPTGFDKLVYLSQVQQALAIRTAVDYWRSLKPHCMGTLYWQLNDTWPVASWSSLDYGGRWKLLHYAARRFFAPVRASVCPVDDTFELRLVNDTADKQAVTVELMAVDMTGRRRLLIDATHSVPTDVAMIAERVMAGSVRNDEILLWRWHCGDGRWQQEHHAPARYKVLDLLDASLSLVVRHQGNAYALTVSSSALALYVTIDSSLPGRFSDNGFDVLPDTPQTVLFTPEGMDGAPPDMTPEFTLQDLRSAC